MFKKLLVAVFGIGMAFGAAASIADNHADMGGCESCHADGAPSADMAHEMEQCVACHGDMADLGSPHEEHDGMLNCSDCHVTHDHESAADANATCESCH
ncbi:cytochrome c3 family protein [Ferrimonas marina]|uniref:Cytochrome c3 n=1 Tax=Ferrimonas marina TaxID=299255 RepID=A0A1M5R9N6_9GAMM|nr:cytochrome c3 family protein [Ferrimonas marina]SHH22736.1 Cytochrome c3 [Ferrimonas marina]